MGDNSGRSLECPGCGAPGGKGCNNHDRDEKLGDAVPVMVEQVRIDSDSGGWGRHLVGSPGKQGRVNSGFSLLRVFRCRWLREVAERRLGRRSPLDIRGCGGPIARLFLNSSPGWDSARGARPIRYLQGPYLLGVITILKSGGAPTYPRASTHRGNRSTSWHPQRRQEGSCPPTCAARRHAERLRSNR